MKLVKEEDFTSRFAADTMAKLKARSQQTNQARIQKYGKGSGQELRNISQEIAAAESEYADELEQLAVQIAKEMYPVVDKYNINIDAKIEPFGSNTDIPKGEFDDEQDQGEPTYTPKEKEDAVAKRELINALSQGAGVRSSTAYKGMDYYVDYLNDINPELIEKYDRILGLAVGGYDDDQVITTVLARISNSDNMPGGSSYPVWDKEKKQWTVVARGINFPILMHEIGKGIYSVIGQQGFSKNKQLNKATISAADKLKYEPAGLRYGKFMIDDIGEVLADLSSKYKIQDDRVRELFFTQLYQLPYQELYSFVENSINRSLTPSQEAWARQALEKVSTLKEAVGTQHYLMLTPKQLELFKQSGAKYNSNTNELFIPELLKIELDKNVTNSTFKKEFYDLVPPEYKQLSSQVLTGLKKALSSPIKINNQPYYAVKGKKSKKDTFYFDNPYNKQK